MMSRGKAAAARKMKEQKTHHAKYNQKRHAKHTFLKNANASEPE